MKLVISTTLAVLAIANVAFALDPSNVIDQSYFMVSYGTICMSDDGCYGNLICVEAETQSDYHENYKRCECPAGTTVTRTGCQPGSTTNNPVTGGQPGSESPVVAGAQQITAATFILAAARFF